MRGQRKGDNKIVSKEGKDLNYFEDVDTKQVGS